jgi:hypothetical protein
VWKEVHPEEAKYDILLSHLQNGFLARGPARRIKGHGDSSGMKAWFEQEDGQGMVTALLFCYVRVTRDERKA